MSGDSKAEKESVGSTKADKSAMGWRTSGATRNVLIDVFADTDGDGFVEFSHKWKFENEHGDPDKPGKIDLPKGKNAYRFHFRLRDRTDPRKSLSFKKPCEEAMWVSVGTHCPGGEGNGCGQIQFNHPWTPDVLVVEDLNSNVPEMVFKYALRFDGDPGEQPGNPPKPCPPYEYDPDFKNGGGNT